MTEKANRALLPVLLLVVLAFTAYGLSFWVPFVFDDAPVVTRNRLLWSWSWDGVLDLARWQVTRFLTNFTFLVNFQIAHGGQVPGPPFDLGDTWSYHAFSICLHAANGVLLFLCVKGLLRAKAGLVPERTAPFVALVGAAVWVLHPVNTMAVTYIAQRYALLAGFAALGTTLLYVRLRLRMLERGTTPGQEALGYVAVVVCVTLSLATKENAAVVPVALVAVELCFFDGEHLRAVALFFVPHVILGVASVLYLGPDAFVGRFLPPESPNETTRVEYFTTQTAVTLRYLHLWLFPYDLTVEQSFPLLWDGTVREWTSAAARATALTAALGHGLLVTLCVTLFVRGLRLVPFAIAWFYVLNIVESSFIPIIDPMVDHRMYLPLAFLAPAVAAAFARAWPRLSAAWPHARVGVVAATTLLGLALVLGTVSRVALWTSPRSLWKDTIAKRPDCARAYSSLGMEHLYVKDWGGAVGPIETALALGPYHVEGWNNLGKAYLELGLWRRAEQALLRGIEVNDVKPSDSVRMCWNNVALVYRKLADIDRRQDRPEFQRAWLMRAAQYLSMAVELDPDYEVAYLNLADVESDLVPLFDDPWDREVRARRVLAALERARGAAELRGAGLSAYRQRQRALAVAELGEYAQAFTLLLELIPTLPASSKVRRVLPRDLSRVALAADEAQDESAPILVARAILLLDAELGPRSPPQTLVLRGRLAHAQGKRADAIQFLRLGLEGVDDPHGQRVLDVLERTAGPR